ncbi:MAG: hypothetical protein LBM68_01895 [Bacteroidales bacterium]|jgi:hypothetical protein|nr:hypothetical protein [Bacteroidales bacterium]
MKKCIVTLFLAALGSSLFAQGDVFNATFLTFSYQNPVGKWGKIEDLTHGSNLKRFYKDTYEAREWGMSLESGTTFYFHNFEPTDGLKFAIAWDFLDIGMNLFRYDDDTYTQGLTTFETVKCYDLYANYSMNVGPMITYSPLQGLCIDLYAKWRPTVGVNAYRQLFFDGPEKDFDDALRNKIYTSDPDYRHFVNEDGSPKVDRKKFEEIRIGGSLGTFSFGLNVRYEFVMIGLEYITGKMHYVAADPLPQQKVWNQMMRFKLGLVFNDKY